VLVAIGSIIRRIVMIRPPALCPHTGQKRLGQPPHRGEFQVEPCVPHLS